MQGLQQELLHHGRLSSAATAPGIAATMPACASLRASASMPAVGLRKKGSRGVPRSHGIIPEVKPLRLK